MEHQEKIVALLPDRGTHLTSYLAMTAITLEWAESSVSRISEFISSFSALYPQSVCVIVFVKENELR